jgi:hypothetical protein
MTKYSDWIIWNAREDSVCPVPKGTMGQVQLDRELREVAEIRDVDLSKLDWGKLGKSTIIAYRTVVEDTPLPISDEFWKLMPNMAGAAMNANGVCFVHYNVATCNDWSWRSWLECRIFPEDTTGIDWKRSWTPNPYYKED